MKLQKLSIKTKKTNYLSTHGGLERERLFLKKKDKGT